jgi:Tfp pilus assembly protein PilF
MIKDKKIATIKKELTSLITYPYSDASPIPEFGRLYPYNRFDGYTNNGQRQDWEMIVLENDCIKLWVNPAVGGKIWGAVEKSTNREFIYFNHVAKFRDVAMRGPWTSGGMETNMGIIGHAPSCSSPVDHHMRNNTDGSVSCFLSATDWPSRTTWTVEICLPGNTAYFITRCSWYNNSGLEQSYYQWTNVGIKASGNLEYVNPGHKRIGHDGQALNWPVDEDNREISFYDKNNFGEYKSYHVFGSYSDFWGCYWHNDNFGLGHSSAYDEKPGKKIWIWGLSRYGMIWEDLLTDTNGQYTELQSGRLFNQSISSSSKTPFKHSSFLPYTLDTWEECWFPVKDIDGLTYVNQQLSFYLTIKNDVAQLNICSNQPLNHQLKVEYNGELAAVKHLVLDAMQTTAILLPRDIKPRLVKIWLNNQLIYDATEQKRQLSRPSAIPADYNFGSVQALFIQAKEWERQRFFERAIAAYFTCLKKDPFYIEALNGLAGIYTRQTRYYDALKLITTALSVDTYHPEANYLYGIINTRLNQIADAKDGFSIASQSTTYRSAAYTELARLFIKEQQLEKAFSYLKKALQASAANRQALQLMVLIYHLQYKSLEATNLADELIKANPLDHLVRFELYLLGRLSAEAFTAAITSELPYETYLELAGFYFNLGQYNTCLHILAMSPGYAMVSIYTAYLHGSENSASMAHHLNVAVNLPSDLVFPHREEDIKVLEWAVANNNSWKLKYYLALGYTQMQRTTEAMELLLECKNEPDFYPFYIIRANLQRTIDEHGCEKDLNEAYKQAPAQWRTAWLLSKYLGTKKRWKEALAIVSKSFAQNTGNYYLGLQLAKCLMNTSAFNESIWLMNRLSVLPNEGALDGRNIWRETHLFAALNAIREKNWPQAVTHLDQARQWPENLGVGKPYHVDERLENFLEVHCRQQESRNIPTGSIDYITSYRDCYPDTPYNSNDFLTVYLLLQYNQFNKAQQVLDNWQQQNSADLALKWSIAFFSANTEELENIMLIPRKKREPLPYEVVVEDRSFPFIKNMYKKHIFNMIYKTA